MQLGHEIAKLAGKILKPIRAGDDRLARAGERSQAKLGVSSSSFGEGQPIPSRYAGPNGVSPALAWTGLPPGTREVAVLCEDPDAPFPKPFVHWVVYGLAPTTTNLPEGLPRDPHLPVGGTQGKNSTHGLGYTGPKPPPGHGVHHYHFEVFALDAPVDLPPEADREDLISAMKGHVLALGEVVGTYEAT